MADVKVDNIDSVVESVNVVTRHSAKSDKDYKLVQIKLDNGYEIEQFVDKAVLFMIESLAKGAKSS